MAAVIAGRGDGGDIDLVADALHQAGYLEDLISKAKRAQPVVKEIVSAAGRRAGVLGYGDEMWLPCTGVLIVYGLD